MPASAKWQARRMQPTAILQLAGWKKKWTSHGELLVEIVQLYSEEIYVASRAESILVMEGNTAVVS